MNVVLLRSAAVEHEGGQCTGVLSRPHSFAKQRCPIGEPTTSILEDIDQGRLCRIKPDAMPRQPTTLGRRVAETSSGTVDLHLTRAATAYAVLGSTAVPPERERGQCTGVLSRDDRTASRDNLARL